MVQYQHRKKRRRKSERLKKKAMFSEAIKYLLQQGINLRTKNQELSREYFQSARKLGMRGRFHLPKPYRLLFCHLCFNPLNVDGMKIRLNSKKKQIHYQCLECGHEYRFGYRKAKDHRE
jgi:RNase P subunit RPR2